MNFTARENYGLCAMLDIAQHAGEERVQACEIARRQSIPLQYLEHLLGSLRVAELIVATRGKRGGYRLVRPASQVTVGDIFQALSGPLLPPELLLGGRCGSPEVDAVRRFWQAMHGSLLATSCSITLADLLGAGGAREKVIHGEDSISGALRAEGEQPLHGLHELRRVDR